MWLQFPVSCGTVSQCLSGGCGLHYVFEGLFTSLANQSILIKFHSTHSGLISCKKRSLAPTHKLKRLHKDWRWLLFGLFVQTCAVVWLESISSATFEIKLQILPHLLHTFIRLSHRGPCNPLTFNKCRQERNLLREFFCIFQSRVLQEEQRHTWCASFITVTL